MRRNETRRQAIDENGADGASIDRRARPLGQAEGHHVLIPGRQPHGRLVSVGSDCGSPTISGQYEVFAARTIGCVDEQAEPGTHAFT